MNNLTAVSSRVRLARNFADLPFELSGRPEDAESVVSRTLNALSATDMGERFTFVRLSELPPTQKESLAESHLISEDLLKNDAQGAALLDTARSVTIMMNEDDHIRVQALRAGDDLEACADRAFEVDDALSGQLTFAFDSDLGYLTACPTNTGTGLRASMQLHLPMLTYFKQMGSVGQTVAKVGLNIHGVYGEGSEALGDLYQISNQATLGRTEQEILRTVSTVGAQLAEMEEALRARLLEEEKTQAEDLVYRAYGVLSAARVLGLNEFYTLWSRLRLGMQLGMITPGYVCMDRLHEQVQKGHLCAYRERRMEGSQLDIARAAFVREALREEQIVPVP